MPVVVKMVAAPNVPDMLDRTRKLVETSPYWCGGTGPRMWAETPGDPRVLAFDDQASAFAAIDDETSVTWRASCEMAGMLVTTVDLAVELLAYERRR